MIMAQKSDEQSFSWVFDLDPDLRLTNEPFTKKYVYRVGNRLWFCIVLKYLKNPNCEKKYVFEDVQWIYYFQCWWAILKTNSMDTDPSKAATLVQENNCLFCARVENKLVYLWSNRANSSGRLCNAEGNWNSIIRIQQQKKLKK